MSDSKKRLLKRLRLFHRLCRCTRGWVSEWGLLKIFLLNDYMLWCSTVGRSFPSEWMLVSECYWAIVSEWIYVSEWMRDRECMWVNVTERMWVSECYWVNVSEWMYVSECYRVNVSEWMYVSECYWVNVIGRMSELVSVWGCHCVVSDFLKN